MIVPFAEWRPDVAELNSNFTGTVLNVLPADGSYMPFPAFAPFSEALPQNPLGAFLSRSLDGTIRLFCGTSDDLYVLNNVTLAWDVVTQSGGDYNATEEARWSFAQFGDFVIAVNQNDDPQVFDLTVSTEFRDLGGSPPRAGIVKVWGDFVALMQLTSNPDRVQWSGLNDCEFWTPGAQNSDYQVFPDGGVVQGSTEATNPIIFQQRAIRRATFVPGSIEIFTFQKIQDMRGAKSALSIAARGSYAFYADEGGFFQIGPDGSLANIGAEKINRTIFGAMQSAEVGRILGAVDPFFSRVYWAVNLSGGESYDTLLIYDWDLQRWTQAALSFFFVFPAATIGYTLEGLDAISTSLEELGFSLDSKIWQGGAPLLAAFDIQGRLGFFSGDNMEATLTTQEMGDVSKGIVRTTSVFPIVDSTQVYVSIGFRFRRTDEPTWLDEQIPSANTGRVRKLSRARFHRFSVRIPTTATWSHAQGIDVATAPAGER